MMDAESNSTTHCAIQTLQSNCTANLSDHYEPDEGNVAMTVTFTFIYGLICAVGLTGNGLVIFVILRYAKMKTVTNMYILNLAVADLCFLIGLPFLMTTALVKQWVFGYVMCKIFMILTSINWFTSVFTLTVMSADRYMAVCHPVRSMRYRTPVISRLVCACVWTASFLVMLPIMLYATTVVEGDKKTCTILWPKGQPIPGEKAFIWYALLLGFAIPVALISVFYAMVVLRLQTVGPKNKSHGRRRIHKKVTVMVLTVIAVYVICWSPYWVFQIVLSFAARNMAAWSRHVFNVITILSYANSMLNPLLYAFLSDNFRKSFIKAFKCATVMEVNGTLQVEQSLFPTRNKSKDNGVTTNEEIEFNTTTRLTNCSPEDGNDENHHKAIEANEVNTVTMVNRVSDSDKPATML